MAEVQGRNHAYRPVIIACLILGILQYGLSSHSRLTPSSGNPGQHFVRVKEYDGLIVFSRFVGGSDLFARSLSRCASQCSARAWCTSFFYVRSRRLCSLQSTVFVWQWYPDLTLEPGSVYFKNMVDWCHPRNNLLYNRPARMCVYFETSPSRLASNWSTADSACANIGMRLASNITPIKMDALLNFTTTHHGLDKPILIGLKRTPPGAPTLEWVDGEPLDTAALQPYWETKQPNGACCGQDCVTIRANADSLLNDVSCDAGPQFQYVCELLESSA